MFIPDEDLICSIMPVHLTLGFILQSDCTRFVKTRLNIQDNGLGAWWPFSLGQGGLGTSLHMARPIQPCLPTQRGCDGITGLWSDRSFARQPMSEENLLKHQKGHGVHPGVQSGPCTVCPSCGVWLPSKVFLLRQAVVCGIRSQRHRPCVMAAWPAGSRGRK